MTDERQVPKGRFERVVQLAKLGAGTGLGLVAGKGAQAVAEQAAHTLSNLRGLAAKVGQMASTVEGILPESWETPVAAALAQLRDKTTNSPIEQIESVIEAEFGAPPGKLFENFEPVPIASASIGQVHRATLHDGRVVAVKVQHPGIEQAITSDLSNVRLMERLVGTIAPKGANVDEVFEEVAKRLREELDYRIEARHQKDFFELHRGSPGVVIPEVIDGLSGRRVLTTVLFQGKKLEEILSTATEAERHDYAATLFRFVFRSILISGRFNADPHPGNFLFGPAPQVCFLDFGCVQVLPDRRRLLARAVHEAALDRDESRFARAVGALLETKGGRFERFTVDFTRRAFEPLFSSPFHMRPEYLRGLIQWVRDSKMALLRERGPLSAFPPELALMNRLQFGFYSLLSRFDVPVDYAAIDRAILAEG